MDKLKYITIQPGEDFEDALSKIRREAGGIHFVAYYRPQNLTGNFKILTLNSKYNMNNTVKIDGPGFIIDKLFEYFLMGGKSG